jgi:titin
MHCGIARFLAAASATGLLAACDEKKPLAPAEDDIAMVVSAAGTLPSQDLTATAGSPSTIDLAWRDDSRNETGFEVHRSTTGPGGSFIIVGATGPNVGAYRDAGLGAETQYCYRVRAFKTSGRKTTYAEFTNTACATALGPPPAPSNADARPISSSAIDFTWTDRSTTEAGFRVERSATGAEPWESVANVAANVTSLRDVERPSEQQVCYRVIGFNAYGSSGPSNSDCITPPLGPTDLVASSEGPVIDLTWVDNSSVETGYELLRSDDGVTFYTVSLLPANSTSARVELTDAAIRWFQVRATRDGGFSDPTNIVSAQPDCQPDEQCANGIDDDCDGLTDGWDESCPGCGGMGECGEGYYCNEYNVCQPWGSEQ